MAGYDPSGRFARVPAACAVCGSTYNEDGFVDTKLDYDFYGVVYFCCSCAFELTTVFPEAPYHTMRARILQLEADIVAKDAQIASTEGILNGLMAERLIDRGVTIIGDTVIGAELPAEPDADEVPDVDAQGPGELDSEPDESVTDEGPVHVTDAERDDVDPILSDL
jgi:hypothetical protein